MGNSGSIKATPLDIEPFWEKPSTDPTLKWGKWQIQFKLLFPFPREENIALHTLLGPPPEQAQLPIYEDTIQGPSKQSERETSPELTV